MKKFKFLALAALLGMSINAMAEDWGNRTFVYTYSTPVAADGSTTAEINGFIQDFPAADMATVTIPATVTSQDGKTLKVISIKADAFKDNKNIKKVIFSSANLQTINATAFSGCTALTEVDFASATGLTTIGANAFAKAPIATLDLSTTKVGDVEILFGTDFNNGDKTKRVYNTTLKTVKLSKYWSTIKDKAFAGCTALATVDFNTVATGTGAPVTQLFETGKDNMFAGCPITSLDFSGTKVTTLPAGLLYDGAIYTKNESLTSVTLTEKFTALNAALSNCTELATVTGHIKDPGKPGAVSALALTTNEFMNDAKLASFDISKLTALADYAFAGTGLTSVAFPKNAIATISEGAYMDCASLATVTWDKDDNTLASIGEKAFAGTAIASITFPKNAAFSVTTAAQIAANAFAACENLKTVIWEDAAATTPTAKWINQSAFAFCEAVNFYTSATEITYWDGTINKVDNVTFKPFAQAPGTVADKLTMTAYKNGNGKYYYKMNATANIAIAKGAAKVYDAWVDATDDAVLNMQAYRTVGGKYEIATGDVCLIVSDTEEVELAEGTGTSSSTTTSVMGYANALKMTPAATTRVTLLLAAPDDTYSLYGWVNSANGTGFQKITSGSSIAKDVLYAYAKEPAAGRLTVNWYDENGNLENETTAIQSVEAQATEAEGESFNLSGQKVAAGYKGIVIKNGKKMIVK